MKHQKQDKIIMINFKHDYYVNSHVIKPMINMIAKQLREHKIIIHFKYGCLKLLFMYVNDSIIMVFSQKSINIKNMKYKSYMINMYMHMH